MFQILYIIIIHGCNFIKHLGALFTSPNENELIPKKHLASTLKELPTHPQVSSKTKLQHKTF
jgi:hypothetical protein